MIFERDLGSALLFFLLFLTILWVATERLSYLFVGHDLIGKGPSRTQLHGDDGAERATEHGSETHGGAPE